MNPFEKKQITVDQLTSVTALVERMKVLSSGKGNKKDASTSKVKDQDLKSNIMGLADTMEAEIKNLFPDTPILVILEVAKRFKKEYDAIARDQLPSILGDIGLSSLSLASGETLEIKDKLEASISDKNYMLARANMIRVESYDKMIARQEIEPIPEDKYDEVMGELSMEATESIDALFKKQLVIDNPTEELKEKILDMGIMYDNKYSIPWQTLRKYCSNQLAMGKSIPEGISVFEYSEAELK